MHHCAYHKIDEPNDAFRLKPNGKLDSWCMEGRREYQRAYGKRKYAPITREEVRARDKGLCWFCNKPIDPDLPYPEPWCEVIHHLHPIAKGGANCLGNVALAHNRCNGRNKTRYKSPFKDGWTAQAIDNDLARKLMEKNHYLHRKPQVSYAFGLYKGNELYGAVTFGTPSSNRISKSVCPDEPRLVIELNRLWINSAAPFGAASWFVSRALKALPPYIVVSYADLEVCDNRNNRLHDGTVYRALSFNYAGKSMPQTDWRLPGSTRNVGRKTEGSVKHIVSAKKRYWTVTGSKKERRTLRAICQWPILDYE